MNDAGTWIKSFLVGTGSQLAGVAVASAIAIVGGGSEEAFTVAGVAGLAVWWGLSQYFARKGL